METNQIDNTILEKIKKLMRLKESAEKVGSLAEAQNAAAKMQNLLTKYNIEIHSISTEEEQKSRIDQSDKLDFKCTKTGGKWKLNLLDVICRYNFCKMIFVNNRYSKTMTIIGDKNNIEVVVFIYNFLTLNLFSLAELRWKEYQKVNVIQNSSFRYTFLRNYLQGAIEGLESKFRKEKREMEQQNSTLTSVILYNDKAIESFVQEKIGKLKTSKTSNLRGHDEAESIGYEDGLNIKIVKALDTEENQTKLLN